MIYRETGQLKASYQADQALFPIAQDRYVIYAVLFVTFVVVPFLLNEYWLNAILLPFLIYALAALGLNILTGYCGQISLGTGAFMAVGAFSVFKLMVAFPELGFVPLVIISGFITAAVGTVFGLPSLRIKGFYLAVATLAAQFFLIWLFNKVGWFFNYNATGMITSPPMTIFGFIITGPQGQPVAKYLLVASFVAVFALVAKNIARGRIGRNWMAIRDMDIAAELMGSFLGAAFLVVLPIVLKNILVDGLGTNVALAAHIEIMTVGVLIITFLIVEPHGLARLWQIAKEKLRLWPFPY